MLTQNDAWHANIHAEAENGYRWLPGFFAGLFYKCLQNADGRCRHKRKAHLFARPPSRENLTQTFACNAQCRFVKLCAAQLSVRRFHR